MLLLKLKGDRFVAVKEVWGTILKTRAESEGTIVLLPLTRVA